MGRGGIWGWDGEVGVGTVRLGLGRGGLGWDRKVGVGTGRFGLGRGGWGWDGEAWVGTLTGKTTVLVQTHFGHSNEMISFWPTCCIQGRYSNNNFTAHVRELWLESLGSPEDVSVCFKQLCVRFVEESFGCMVIIIITGSPHGNLEANKPETDHFIGVALSVNAVIILETNCICIEHNL